VSFATTGYAPWLLVLVYGIIFWFDLGYQFTVLLRIQMPLPREQLELAKKLVDAGRHDFSEAKRHCELIRRLNPNAEDTKAMEDILGTIPAELR
jgi:hypothetical protein